MVSIATRLAWTYLVPNGANFVDLHVYLGGAAALDHPGTLYDYVYADQTPDFPLPFTYPPFAAVLFYPLHLLPFGLVALAWQLGIVAALYGVVRISQRLLSDRNQPGDRRVAMLWTAVGIWIEPLRSTFDYGQVNVLLVLAVLCAVCSTRWWLSGLLVGLAAGVKLTPAVSGLYFLGARRWGAAAPLIGVARSHVNRRSPPGVPSGQAASASGRRIAGSASITSGRSPAPPAWAISKSCRRMRGSQKSLMWAASPATPSACGFDSMKRAIWLAM